jgi:tetratricopeptide (TPR) repeat protein
VDLGRIDFPNSGAGAAQEPFARGVLLLHNFEYEDAAEAFREAQERDPDFALAYWGEAMTHNHPIWMEQDRNAALAVLERLAPTPEERAGKATTEREKAYLHALETLYGNTERSRARGKEGRDDLYRDEMRRLSESYPEDDEAAAFHALSILGTAHEGRDFATYMRAAAVVEPIFERNPRHPGAAHYLIHSYDDPIHAPLGLPMAQAYSEIAPAAAHAQHMTSHIFVAMGMWDDVVEANIVARDVQNAGFEARGRPPRVCGHYTYWLEYGYLQQGRFEEARNVLDVCQERVQAGADPSELTYFANMRARYVLDTGDWGAADRYDADFPDDNWNYQTVTAVAAVRRGDLATARQIHSRLRAAAGQRSPDGTATIASVLERMLAADLLRHQGASSDEVVSLLREAAQMEASMPYEFGPPVVVKPTYELLGEALADLGRHAEAVEAFRAQLVRTPLRTASLLGLARAAAAAGDENTAHEAYQNLSDIWHSADARVPGLEEARDAVES